MMQARQFFESLGWWQAGHDGPYGMARALCGNAKLVFDPEDSSGDRGYKSFAACNVQG